MMNLMESPMTIETKTLKLVLAWFVWTCVEYLPFSDTPLLWLLFRTSVLGMDDFALDFCIFSELWHSPMKGCKSISCVSIHYVEVYATHPLLQWKTSGQSKPY